jgi:hypothetical protein
VNVRAIEKALRTIVKEGTIPFLIVAPILIGQLYWNMIMEPNLDLIYGTMIQSSSTILGLSIAAFIFYHERTLNSIVRYTDFWQNFASSIWKLREFNEKMKDEHMSDEFKTELSTITSNYLDEMSDLLQKEFQKWPDLEKRVKKEARRAERSFFTSIVVQSFVLVSCLIAVVMIQAIPHFLHIILISLEIELFYVSIRLLISILPFLRSNNYI